MAQKTLEWGNTSPGGSSTGASGRRDDAASAGSAPSAITWKEKIGFGMGDAGCNMSFAAVVMYLSYFYTDIYGISPAIVGVIFLTMRIVDAVTDPLMGFVADRTRTRWGKYRPYLLIIPIPLAISIFLLFTTPDWGQNAKIAYAFATYFLMSLLYTAVSIPYCSLGGVVTSDHKERVSFQSYRFFFAGVAYLILTASLLPLVELLGGGDEARGFQLTMGLMSVIALGMFAFCFATTRERVVPINETRKPLLDSLKALARNERWLIILGITFLQALQFFLRQGAAIYFATYVLMLDAGAISFFITAAIVGKMLGSLVSPWFTNRFSKRRVYMTASGIMALGSILLFFVPHDWALLATLFFAVINFIHGIGTPISWSLMADAEDYGEWKTRERNTALSFSGNLFFLKLGLAVAGGLVGLLLSVGGYEAGVEQQADSAILAISLMLTLIPAGIIALLMALIAWFGLDDRQMDDIRRDLDSRRAQQDPAADGQLA
ncbi:MFS transporter [Salinicola aestuarinus]|uniref:MFS transporter n=1 Tax=Salinicola aestuarinus TaxID=1949082 RepID=UPI000DA1F0B8|nr:MFS transporter [Salinicola aestuarinus]